MDHFDVPASAASLVGSALAAMALLYGPVCGYLVNKIGVRASIIIGSALTSSSCLICGLFWTQLPFVVFVAVYGFVLSIGFGILHVPALTTCSFFFKEKQALATGFAMSGSGIGIALLPVVVDRMNRSGGLGTLFLILAPVMGLMIGMAILFPTASEIVERSSLIDQSDQEKSNEPKLVKCTKSTSQPASPLKARQASICDHVLPFKQRLSLHTEKCDDAKFQDGAMDLFREPKICLSLACYSLQVIPAYVPSFYTYQPLPMIPLEGPYLSII